MTLLKTIGEYTVKTVKFLAKSTKEFVDGVNQELQKE